MPTMSDAITVGYREGAKVGRQIIVNAKGKPAHIVAYAVAAGIAAVGVGIGFGLKNLIQSRGKSGITGEPKGFKTAT